MTYFLDFYVHFTVRDDNCTTNSPISHLVLDKPLDGYPVQSIEKLKGLADQGRLWTESRLGFPKAKVRIFQAWNKRWVATTLPDNGQCNNLLSLPIYFGYTTEGTVTYYKSCEVRY